MSHEMMRLAAEMANQNNPKGAAFIREAERIGREAGVLSPSLGLVLLTPEQYTNLLEGNSSEPASPWVDGVLFHPLFTYNSEDRSVYSGEEKVSTLTRTEEDILRFLSERANRVVTPKRLTEDIWGYYNVEGSELVKGRIRSLRTKIPGDKIDSRDHEVIKTIGRGVGYMYRDPSMVKSNVVEIRVGEVESE